MNDSQSTSSGRISLVRPRLDSKPWGGRALKEFGLEFDDAETIGEALITANDAVVVGGFGSGKTLGEIIEADPDRFLGERALGVVGGRALFPLLVKLIDANENLSIQVHPDNDQASTLDRLGKTEAWYVLRARPGSKLYLGLLDPGNAAAFIEAASLLDGSSANHLRSVRAETGSTWLLPAGTVHALGAGVMVYEIQQPSDVTYRLDDWGRRDADGNPREMHRDQGLAVMRPELQPSVIEPVLVHGQDPQRSILVATQFFGLERWHWQDRSGANLPDSIGPQVVTVLSGTLTIGDFGINAGESAVVWPGPGCIRMSGDNATMLRGWVPDESDTFVFEGDSA